MMSRYPGLAQAIYAPPAFIPSGMHWGITSQFPQTIGCLSLPSGNFQRFVMKMFDFLPTIFVTSLCAMDDVATNILMKREESNAQARSV